MIFEAEVGGRSYSVRVEPVGDRRAGRFRLIVDGAEESVAVRETDLGLSIVFADGRVLDAAVTERARGEWLVQLPRVTVDVALNGRQRRGGAVTPARAGEYRITAPMPGRVLRVLVDVGENVAERQGLVVVEAMKMENEIGSPKAGTVKAIAVSEGLSIEAGRLLVVVE